MLYDATHFSGNGEATCASCHIFGDRDELAWDLGNPDNSVTTSPIPINFSGLFPLLLLADASGLTTPLNGSNKVADFHPMKGPFTTQTLRGLAILAWLGLRHQNALLHVHVASRASFWRKCAFMALGRVAGWPIVFHLHGGGFADGEGGEALHGALLILELATPFNEEAGR